MLEPEEEIREIKKEIIESRGLIIRTNNLTTSLAADIKAIAKRQTAGERRALWNGVAAYVLFAALSFVGLKLLSDVRIREVRSEMEQSSRELAALRRDLEAQTQRNERRARAEKKAKDYYHMIRDSKREEVIKGFEAIRQEQLSEMESEYFQNATNRFRAELAISTYQSGLGHMRTGRFAEAVDAFQRALELRGEGSQVMAVKYQLARALARLDRESEAAVLAEEVLQGDDRDLHDDASWLLSQCHEGLGNLEDARKDLRQLLRRWPRSEYGAGARRRISDLSRRIATGSSKKTQ